MSEMLINHDRIWKELKGKIDEAMPLPKSDYHAGYVTALKWIQGRMSELERDMNAQQARWGDEVPITLSKFLRAEIAKGHIDFAIRAQVNEHNDVEFYIHADGHDSDTVDFVIDDWYLCETLQARDHAKLAPVGATEAAK